MCFSSVCDAFIQTDMQRTKGSSTLQRFTPTTTCSRPEDL